MSRIKKQLLNLAIGEFAALLTFIFVYRLLDLGMASLVAFSYLILILLQGSLYWFYRYILIVNKKRVNHKMIELLKFLRRLNMIVLVVISLVIPIIRSSNKDFIIGIGLFLFGMIEYINYYWYRLSYGKSGFNIRILLNTGLQKSSINRLITK
ncbi:TPA: hypothetical protein ACMV87_004000 [Clostridioides difficile]|uniref:Uncharacterized protein n=1 Tax=Aerococcus agrisoli TaxID=2487350 RepID=A0A3N4FWN4_9LACT|nr:MULTISPECIES: hypothetical protein [Lactobacillales]RPA55183.1 hypothetical protein EF384_09650 [Aerococcus agrisoli]